MDLLKYTRETWPIEQMSHKSRRSDEGSNGEYFPRTIDKAVLVSLDERLFIDGYPVLTNENAYDAPDGTHYEPGELLITKYLPDGTENPLYDDLSFSKTPYIVHSDTDLHEALNGLEQRMIYMENNGVGFNSVGKEQLKEGAVDNRALGTASVDSSKIADGSINFQDLNPYTVEQIIDSAVTDAYDIAKDSKTLTFDPDTKKLEVRDAALEKKHFSDKAFDEHYDITSDGALKNKVVTATFGDIICDEDQEGTSADSHGLKITKYPDDDNPDHNDKWVIGEDIADSATTTVSELVRHIVNTDIIVREPKTTEWQIVNEESKEVPYEDFKAEVVTDVTDAFDTKIADYTYNKTDIDAKINNAGRVKDVVVDGTSVVAADGVATIALTGKADKATTYTKDEVDAKLEDAIKIENVKIPNATDPTAGETLPIVDKAVTIPVATGSMFGTVKYGTWDALKSGEIPNPADVVGKVNAKANSIDVYNKADADNKFMPKTTFKTINGEAITGTGNIVIETPDNMVVDVLVNGTTVVDNTTKVAKIELASTQQIGVVGITNEYYNPAVLAHLVPSCQSLRERDTITNKAVDGTTVSFDQYATGVDINYKLIGDAEDVDIHAITLPYANTDKAGIVRLTDRVTKDGENLSATAQAVYYDTVENVAQHVFGEKFMREAIWSKRDISVSIDLHEEIEAPAKFVLQYVPSQFDATKAKNLIAEFRDINGAIIASKNFDATTGTSKTFEIPSSVKKIYSIIIKGSDYSVPVSADQAVLNMSVYTDFVKDLITDRENRTPVIEMADGIDLYETRPVSSRTLYQNMPFHLDADKNIVPVTGKKNVELSHIEDHFVSGVGNVMFGEGDVEVITSYDNLIGADGGTVSGTNGCFIMTGNEMPIDIRNSNNSIILLPSSAEQFSNVDYTLACGASELNGVSHSNIFGDSSANETMFVNIMGSANDIQNMSHSSIFGNDNVATNGAGVFILGQDNTVNGETNYIVGSLNNVSKTGNIIIGKNNTIDAKDVVIIGHNAVAHSSTLKANNTSVAIGAGDVSESNVIEINSQKDVFITGIGNYNGVQISGAISVQDVIADLVDRLVRAETYLEDAHNDIAALQTTCHKLDERLKALEP